MLQVKNFLKNVAKSTPEILNEIVTVSPIDKVPETTTCLSTIYNYPSLDDVERVFELKSVFNCIYGSVEVIPMVIPVIGIHFIAFILIGSEIPFNGKE